jgi:arylsulfatase A-like enzyme
VTLRSGDDLNPFGWTGWCQSAAAPRFKTMHGGLHQREMENFAVAGGSQFKEAVVTARPTNACDIAPTVLAALGLSPEVSWSGRIVDEAMGGSDEPGDLVDYAVSSGNRTYKLQFNRSRERLYLSHGWTTS